MIKQLNEENNNNGAGGALQTKKRESAWSDAVRRLLRNRAAVMGGILIMVIILLAIFAPLVAPKSYETQILTDQNKAPTWIATIFPTMKPYVKATTDYPLGADYVGRDILSRILFGARISLAVAFIGPIISLIIGVIYGSISGYFGGTVDNVMMRLVDVLYAFPSILFIILLMVFRTSFSKAPPGTLASYIGQADAAMGGLMFIFIGIGLTAWETMARLTRGQVLSIREKEFVEAAHTIGATDGRIMFRHILPNIVGPLIVSETLAIPGYISTEAFLSFIGLGITPPTPSWGSMIAEGAQTIRTYPNQAIFPALALAVTMFAFNFLGDGLRDALDPRLRGTQ
jgi:oligopeptide transport system permease protein